MVLADETSFLAKVGNEAIFAGFPMSELNTAIVFFFLTRFFMGDLMIDNYGICSC